MKFLLGQACNLFKKNKSKYQVGFVISNIRPYSRVMASSRLRVYDIINAFTSNKKFHLELYNPLKSYDILIFQKTFGKKAIKIAKKNCKKSKIVLDINVDYSDLRAKEILPEQKEDINEFIKYCDAIITSTEYLKERYSKITKKKIVCIEESIPEKYFIQKDKLEFKNIDFIWSGYSVKAKDLLLIKKDLVNLSKKYSFTLKIIAEKNPELKLGKIPVEYIKYSENKIVDQLLKGNIFLAPRDLNNPYNLGHTFTKIGVAMALGLPVLASPVPSYLDSPAIICKNKDWANELKKVFNNSQNLKILSSEGINYCKKNFDIKKIKSKYESFFEELLK